VLCCLISMPATLEVNQRYHLLCDEGELVLHTEIGGLLDSLSKNLKLKDCHRQLAEIYMEENLLLHVAAIVQTAATTFYRGLWCCEYASRNVYAFAITVDTTLLVAVHNFSLRSSTCLTACVAALYWIIFIVKVFCNILFVWMVNLTYVFIALLTIYWGLVVNEYVTVQPTWSLVAMTAGFTAAVCSFIPFIPSLWGRMKTYFPSCAIRTAITEEEFQDLFQEGNTKEQFEGIDDVLDYIQVRLRTWVRPQVLKEYEVPKHHEVNFIYILGWNKCAETLLHIQVSQYGGGMIVLAKHNPDSPTEYKQVSQGCKAVIRFSVSPALTGAASST